MMELFYAQYLFERSGSEVIIKDYGFISYKINGIECFIVDIFIAKNYRQTEKRRLLLDELSEIAESSGCKILTGNIHLESYGSNHTIMSAISYGFKVVSSAVDVLLISKNLKES